MSDKVVDRTEDWLAGAEAADGIDFVKQYGLQELAIESLKLKIRHAYIHGFMAGRASHSANPQQQRE